MTLIARTFILTLLSSHTLLSLQMLSIAGSAVSDTIPFRLGRDNKIYVEGKINNEPSVDLLFDTGAKRVWLFRSGFEKTSQLIFHEESVSAGLGGEVHSLLSNDNSLRIADRTWDSISVDYLDIQLHQCDGGIGYTLFEDNIVEINFDDRIVIIHDTLFTPEAGYTKCRLEKRNDNYFIEITLQIGGREITEWFDLDTGNSGSLNIGNEFASRQKLYGTMRKISDYRASGIGPEVIRYERVILPKLMIGEYELLKVPISIEFPSKKKNLPFGIIGVDILKRFNIILDFQHGAAFLKPNGLFHSLFQN